MRIHQNRPTNRARRPGRSPEGIPAFFLLCVFRGNTSGLSRVAAASAATYRVIRRSYKVRLEILAGLLDPTVLEKELCGAGTAAEVVHEPGYKISVYPFGQEAAARWFDESVLQPLDISHESVMVIGDEIQLYGGDRHLFEYYRRGRPVNVGRPVYGLQGGV